MQHYFFAEVSDQWETEKKKIKKAKKKKKKKEIKKTKKTEEKTYKKKIKDIYIKHFYTTVSNELQYTLFNNFSIFICNV